MPSSPTYSLRKNRLKVVASTPSSLDPVLRSPFRRHRLPVAYGGFRNAFGVFHFCFKKEGRFAPAGNQTNRPSFRKHFWEAVVRERSAIPPRRNLENGYMFDPTEAPRRERLAEINAMPGSREALEAKYGQVWSTVELADTFKVIGFMAPLVVVRRKSDGVEGSLEFQHSPRFYFNFEPDKK